MTSNPQVHIADWQSTPALREIRQKVFIEEQNVAPELEWDDQDPLAIHFLLTHEQRELGTARLLSDGHIGRVALLPEARGKGWGHLLMQAVMDYAQRQGMTQLELSAQTHALGFYQSLGFTVCSDVYMDVGIPHQSMRWAAP